MTLQVHLSRQVLAPPFPYQWSHFEKWEKDLQNVKRWSYFCFLLELLFAVISSNKLLAPFDVWNILVTFNASTLECMSCLIDINLMRCESVFISHFHSDSIGIGVKPSLGFYVALLETHKKHNLILYFYVLHHLVALAAMGLWSNWWYLRTSQTSQLIFHFRPSG